MLILALVGIVWNHGLLPFPPKPGQKKVKVAAECVSLSTCVSNQGLMNARQVFHH